MGAIGRTFGAVGANDHWVLRRLGRGALLAVGSGGRGSVYR